MKPKNLAYKISIYGIYIRETIIDIDSYMYSHIWPRFKYEVDDSLYILSDEILEDLKNET